MINEIIVELRKIENGKSAKVKAEVTIDTPFGEITICRLRVIHQDGKEPWVAYPEIRFLPQDSTEYINLKIILPSKRLRAAISDAVIQKYESMKFDAPPF